MNYKHCFVPGGDGPAHACLLSLPPLPILPFSRNLEAALRLPPGPAYLPQVHKHVRNAFLLSCLELIS